jgi:hypothetical protein
MESVANCVVEADAGTDTGRPDIDTSVCTTNSRGETRSRMGLEYPER